jgi:hypothetical protein
MQDTVSCVHACLIMKEGNHHDMSHLKVTVLAQCWQQGMHGPSAMCRKQFMATACHAGRNAWPQHAMQEAIHGPSTACRKRCMAPAHRPLFTAHERMYDPSTHPLMSHSPAAALRVLVIKCARSCTPMQPADQHEGTGTWCDNNVPAAAPVVAVCQLAGSCCGISLLCCCHADSGSTYDHTAQVFLPRAFTSAASDLPPSALSTDVFFCCCRQGVLSHVVTVYAAG